MPKDFFKGKKILITGITGFVGQHLARTLESFDAQIYGISKHQEGRNIYKANILEYNKIDQIVKERKISICYHLAGESLVESGQDNPYETFKINTEGTLNILEISRKQNMERIIIASTSHVYGKNKLPYYEGYTPKPSRPYETSKACTDLIAQSYTETYNLPVVIPRFVNIYGPGDVNYNRLIPKTMRSIILGQAPIMWGGKAVRDYLFIDDAIDGYIKLAMVDIKKVGKNRIFNFGSGNRISVKDLIEKIITIAGGDIVIRKIPEERVDEIPLQYVSFNKATKLLGWEPKVSLDDGLKISCTWYTRLLKQGLNNK